MFTGIFTDSGLRRRNVRGVYECQECGSAHLGRESAYRCCAEQMTEYEAAEAV